MRTINGVKLAGLSLIFLTACSKYTDIKTQGALVNGKLDNYSLLLNSTSNFAAGPSICDYASDDIQLVDGSSQQKELAANTLSYDYYMNAYTWQPTIYAIASANYQDYTWSNLYNSVTIANIIVNEVPTVDDATPAQQEPVIAQALVHRADAYLSLVNVYSKPYNRTTAGADLGVPLVLVQTTTQPLVRASVQTVYDQILSDLRRAIPSLPPTQNFSFIPSKASGYGVLARCFFYMNMYDSAARYADSALAYKATVLDLSTVTDPAMSYPQYFNNPEILLAKQARGYSGTTYGPATFRLSDTLLHVLGDDDQRYNLYTTTPENISFDYTDAGGRFFFMEGNVSNYNNRNVGVTVPEMMLIKAEYLARTGSANAAMDLVNQLRIKRIKQGSYIALTATNADDALVKVIQERQREFFCRMLRWWDLRRLNSEARFQTTITRRFNGTTYTLAPNSNRYVFPISEYNRRLNPEIEQNPR